MASLFLCSLLACSLWTHPLLIPSYFTFVSIAALILQYISSSSLFNRVRARISTTTEDTRTGGGESNINGGQIGLISAVKDHVGKLGGSTIFFCQLARLVVVLTLFNLSVISFLHDGLEEQNVVEAGLGALGKHWGGKKRENKGNGSPLSEREWLDLAMSLTYVCPRTHLLPCVIPFVLILLCPIPFQTQLYASFLGLVSVSARSTRASVASVHLLLLLLVTLSVYAYRDIWPLLTFTLFPEDASEGVLLWEKIGLLAVAGIIIPLVTPRQYVPLDPKV